MGNKIASRALLALAVLSGIAAAPACSGTTTPAAGLLLVIRADSALTSEATQLHIQVTSTDGSIPYRNTDYAIPGDTRLPTTLGIATNGNPAASVLINASLFDRGTLLDERKNQVIEIPTNRVVELSIDFSASCTATALATSADAGGGCSSAETCDPSTGGCVTDVVNASTLGTFTGDAGLAEDAGVDLVDATLPPGTDAGQGGCSTVTCANGCCGSDGACHTDEGSTTCGTGGQSCATCSPAQTCSGAACVDKCTASSCAAGCCDGNGDCQTTTTNTVCGTAGALCGACTGSNQCVSGKCGCATSADCPAQQACNSDHTCSSACSATATCNGGCCNAGVCAAGTSSATCGSGGAACVSCAANANGTFCEAGGTCGCGGPGDCAAGNACNTATHTCSTSCAGGLACAGACCTNDTALCVKPGGNDCNGTTPQTCNPSDQWTDEAIVAGTCTAICSPTATQCAGPGGATRQTCNSAGTAWVSDPVTVNVCGAVCSAGTAQCGQPGMTTIVNAASPDGTFLEETGNGTQYPYLQTCTASGQWGAPTNCTKSIIIQIYGGGEACGNCHGVVECGVQDWSYIPAENVLTCP